MITAICDKCKISMVAGYVCKMDYIGDDSQSRLNWSMQQSRIDIKHLCYSCMNKIFSKEEKK